MKKQLLLITASLVISASTLLAQVCTPDPQYTANGVYPDSATGLPDAIINVLYSQVITTVVPNDTSITTPISGTVRIDSVVVTNWNDNVNLNMPPGISIFCNTPNCRFLGNSKDCMKMIGTVTDINDIGYYELNVKTSTYVTGVSPIFIAGQKFTQNDVISYYSITVDTLGVSVNNLSDNTFVLNQNTPNPFSGSTAISFRSANKGSYELKVYNILGEVVYNKTVSAVPGENKVTVDASRLPIGVYSYSLSNGHQTLTKRMVVTEK